MVDGPYQRRWRAKGWLPPKDPAVSGFNPADGHAEGCGAHDDYDCDCASKVESDTDAAASEAGEVVERLRETLGDAQEWRDKRLELYDWTGSAWLSGGEKQKPPKGVSAFLTSLIGFLMAGEDAASALTTQGGAEG